MGNEILDGFERLTRSTESAPAPVFGSRVQRSAQRSDRTLVREVAPFAACSASADREEQKKNALHAAGGRRETANECSNQALTTCTCACAGTGKAAARTIVPPKPNLWGLQQRVQESPRR